MDSTTFCWISCDDTHILMRRTQVGQLHEWQPVGQITLRQIYTTSRPRQYAWLTSDVSPNQLVGIYDDLTAAKKAVEKAVNG